MQFFHHHPEVTLKKWISRWCRALYQSQKPCCSVYVSSSFVVNPLSLSLSLSFSFSLSVTRSDEWPCSIACHGEMSLENTRPAPRSLAAKLKQRQPGVLKGTLHVCVCVCMFVRWWWLKMRRCSYFTDAGFIPPIRPQFVYQSRVLYKIKRKKIHE
jgi:hypothetical protein